MNNVRKQWKWCGFCEKLEVELKQKEDQRMQEMLFMKAKENVDINIADFLEHPEVLSIRLYIIILGHAYLLRA